MSSNHSQSCGSTTTHQQSTFLLSLSSHLKALVVAAFAVLACFYCCPLLLFGVSVFACCWLLLAVVVYCSLFALVVIACCCLSSQFFFHPCWYDRLCINVSCVYSQTDVVVLLLLAGHLDRGWCTGQPRGLVVELGDGDRWPSTNRIIGRPSLSFCYCRFCCHVFIIVVGGVVAWPKIGNCRLRHWIFVVVVWHSNSKY